MAEAAALYHRSAGTVDRVGAGVVDGSRGGRDGLVATGGAERGCGLAAGWGGVC